VRGFDFEDRGGGSEPTSPDRRERAGTPNNCRGQHPRTRCLVPTSSASHPAQPLGRNRGAIQSGSPPGPARGPGGTSHSGWGRRRLLVNGDGPRPAHQLRSEKPRQGLGRRGFDSRHLHDEIRRVSAGHSVDAKDMICRVTQIWHSATRPREPPWFVRALGPSRRAAVWCTCARAAGRSFALRTLNPTCGAFRGHGDAQTVSGAVSAGSIPAEGAALAPAETLADQGFRLNMVLAVVATTDLQDPSLTPICGTSAGPARGQGTIQPLRSRRRRRCNARTTSKEREGHGAGEVPPPHHGHALVSGSAAKVSSDIAAANNRSAASPLRRSARASLSPDPPIGWLVGVRGTEVIARARVCRVLCRLRWWRVS
jgi:hypothetical protein